MKEPKKERDHATQADIATWQSKMRSVVLETVNEDAIREVLAAVLAKAKDGNLQAARLILSYAIGNPPSRELDDKGPTGAKGGTKAKLDVLAHRYANGLPMHVNGDGGDDIDLS